MNLGYVVGVTVAVVSRDCLLEGSRGSCTQPSSLSLRTFRFAGLLVVPAPCVRIVQGASPGQTSLFSV